MSWAGKRSSARPTSRKNCTAATQIAAAPDLVLLSNPGFDLKGGLEKDQEAGNSHFTGMHRQDNAFFACSRGDLLREPMTIFDVKSLLYRLMAI